MELANNASFNISVKSIDEDERRLEGWASRSDEDRQGDIVVPKGAIYELPLPFLLDHDHSKAVGLVDRVQITDKGIKFWAHIKKISEEGEAKRLTDYAWTLVKNGLRSVTSIGFRSLDAEPLPNSRGLKFNRWEWLELSAVTVAAQAGARITSIKSMGDDTYITVPRNFQAEGIPLVHKAGPSKPDLGGAVKLVSRTS